MVWTCWIAWRRTDTFVFLIYQLLIAKALIHCVSPVFFSYFPMQKFRKRLRKPICQSLRHDGRIVIILGFIIFHQFIRTKTSRHCESTYIVLFPSALRRYKIRQSEILLPCRFFQLLAKCSENEFFPIFI